MAMTDNVGSSETPGSTGTLEVVKEPKAAAQLVSAPKYALVSAGDYALVSFRSPTGVTLTEHMPIAQGKAIKEAAESEAGLVLVEADGTILGKVSGVVVRTFD